MSEQKSGIPSLIAEQRSLLLEAVQKYGTPIYVYDLESIEQQYQKLVDAFANIPYQIKYAAKALTNIHVLRFIRQLGCGVEASSIQEVQIALQAGFSPEQIFFTPNCVEFEEITEGIKLGVQLNIDSLSFLERLGYLYGSSVPISLRINPHVLAGGHAHISTGHIDSKFGISIYQKRHLRRIINSYQIPVRGLHMHTGSDILDPHAFLQAMDILFDFALEFEGLEFLNFGSGFKVKYRDDDVETDVVTLGKLIEQKYADFSQQYGKAVEIWFEPGKYLVSQSGWFLVSATVVKPTPSTVFVGVNSGFNHLIRPMLYGAYHRIYNLSNPEGIPRIYTVVGYLCETDTFAYDRTIPEVREGDVLAFANAGAYGYMMASNYNSRVRPAEVAIYRGALYLIRARESLNDLLRLQTDALPSVHFPWDTKKVVDVITNSIEKG